MATGGLMDTAAGTGDTPALAISGLVSAEVIDNVDMTNNARVQLRLPFPAGMDPWARVAVPLAGAGRGSLMIPQIGDEVLVGFADGDLREPYVVGGLWNGSDNPPIDSPLDPGNKIVIRTTAGHEIEIDDLRQTITITTSTDQKVELAPKAITVATAKDTASLTLGTDGAVAVKGSQSISLKAPSITIEATTSLDLKGSASAKLNGGTSCSIQGGTVSIN